MLAFHIYPFPDGREYDRNELSNETNVIQLFDACQILEAIITSDGWEYLIDQYGIEKLFKLDCASGWHDEKTLSDYISIMLVEPGFVEGYVSVLNCSLQGLLHQEVTTDFEIVELGPDKMNSFNNRWTQKLKETKNDRATNLKFNYQTIAGSATENIVAMIEKNSEKYSEDIVSRYVAELERLFGGCKACWKFSGKNKGSGNFLRDNYINMIDLIILEYELYALVLMIGV